MKRMSLVGLLAGALLTTSAAAQDTVAPAQANAAAIARGGDYMGFAERFNRYYTDPGWRPSRIVYVSPSGGGNGAARETPASAQSAIRNARPGTLINFVRGNYQACFNFDKDNSGSYDEPIVLYAERNQDRTIGVKMNCCNVGRQACFNFEDADYIAVDGFEMVGGKYGVRAVGADYAASQHSRGIAVLNSDGHDQTHDPVMTSGADWAVLERNIAYNAQKGDGHGIYISGGSDWNVVRFNETHSNASSDFQVNADPDSTCKEAGIPFNDPRCDAFAGEGEGGRGASDYLLIDSNYFHHSSVGPNFTSVRRSIIRNNIFGPQERHNVSFWQETDNPKLGSTENQIVNNLFITTGRHGVQFQNNSTANEFINNVILGVRMNGSNVTANPSAMLMEVDNTVGGNVYRSNLYVSGKFEGRKPSAQETARPDFSQGWYTKFPTALSDRPDGFKPVPGAPFAGLGSPSPFAPSDRDGAQRAQRAYGGPYEGR